MLHGHYAALRVWSTVGADLVLGGHIHLPYMLALHGLARRLWVVQAGTTVSSRTRPEAPNSVNILRWGAASGARGDKAQTGSEAVECCFIEQWDFARHDRFFVRTVVTPGGQSATGRTAVPATGRGRRPPARAVCRAAWTA